MRCIMNRVNNYILKAIGTMIDSKLSGIYYDKTFPSIIFDINNDGTYKISKDGFLYDVPCAFNVELKKGQGVWVTMPCGITNIKDMFISGIRRK